VDPSVEDFLFDRDRQPRLGEIFTGDGLQLLGA
jgi:hypothetical protein